MDSWIELDGISVPVTIRCGGVRRINLRLHPDGSLHLSAPRSVPMATLQEFLLQHADWYRRARAQQLARRCALPKSLQTGAEFWYLGRKRTLILQDSGDSVLTDDALYLPDKDRALEQWFTDQAKAMLPELVQRLVPQVSVPEPALRYRHMRAAWGNCRKREAIVTFNPRLLCADPACIELVVAHELCHLIHPDHSAAFYAELTRVLPDAKQRQLALAAYCAVQIS